jgi:hypothetical protein
MGSIPKAPRPPNTSPSSPPPNPQHQQLLIATELALLKQQEAQDKTSIPYTPFVTLDHTSRDTPPHHTLNFTIPY